MKKLKTIKVTKEFKHFQEAASALAITSVEDLLTEFGIDNSIDTNLYEYRVKIREYKDGDIYFKCIVKLTLKPW